MSRSALSFPKLAQSGRGIIAALSEVKSPGACWRHLACGAKLVATQSVAKPVLAANLRQDAEWRLILLR